MNAATKNKWDVKTTVGGLTLTMVAIFIGIYQFNKGQAQIESLEFKKELLAKKDVLYTELTREVGIIAGHTKEADFINSSNRFENMYWGSIHLVSDAPVRTAMIILRESIHDYTLYNKNTEGMIRIQLQAAALLDSCRLSCNRKERQ